MAKLNDFLKYLEEQVKNHSIYVWGAQGQTYPVLTESWIKEKESGVHRTNALKMYRAAVAAGCKETCRAFDCSGLGMYWLQNVSGLCKTDMTANGLMGKCSSIQKSQLKRGDWVFRVYTSGSNKGRAYHVGYVVDNDLNVIESKGRAYGVVKNTLNGYGNRYWNAFGRPSYFKKEIEKETKSIELNVSRILKLTTPYMKGEDVKALQLALNEAGVDAGSPDGIFGKNTQTAVKKYQKLKGLTVDGIVGKKTVEALGGTWKKEDTWSVSRNLKYGCEGEDVKNLQNALTKCGYSCGKSGADGDFGKNTQKAVTSYQAANNLVPDGIAGKKTIVSLGGKWIYD